MQNFKIHKQYVLYLYKTLYRSSRTKFHSTPQKIQLPKEEEKTLQYWNEIDAFQQQLKRTKHLKPFTFYDGPPFATGLPHYGHIAAGTIKDVVCRYATQKGHYVQRRFGWDCHGLPVEYEIDKELGIKDKRQVLEMGIDKYNQECRKIVMKYSKEWRGTIGRLGRWIDFDNDYKTLNPDFMESVWYVFKQIFKKGLIYRGRKVMPYSTACNTVLSNFETNLNFKQDIVDPSVYVTFPLVSDPNVKFVAWTTTPWTLPSNLALTLNPNFDYIKIKDIKRNQIYIIAECRVKELYAKDPNGYQILQRKKGKQYQGLQYIPLFKYFIDRKQDGCFRVLCGDFVTTDAGTGVVHCAPGFGQEDYKICVKKGIIHPDKPVLPIDENGRFTKEVQNYAGLYFKDADKPIKQELKQSGRLIMQGTIKHNYPYCWRSDTPLMYRAVHAWFIKVTAIKQDMIRNNKKAYWVPKQVQQGRFDSWLNGAEDWCFSRNRFWGNPIPIWISDDGEQVVCVGSIQQLKDLTGTNQQITDIHRQFIDKLTIPSKQGKGVLRRIQQVFDCWFESGAMPYAQVHYPFTTSQQKFKTIFPADFIGQGIDQTRGWFYTLNVLGTALRNDTPYKNLIVNGLALAADGQKMSKRLKNYPPPEEIVNEFGADAIRLYLINSPLVRAENLCFKKQGVEAVVKEIFLPWYNAYRFLIQNITKLENKKNQAFIYNGHIQKLYNDFNITDKWIESCLQQLIKDTRKQMDQYKLYTVVPKLVKFLDLLTNWYVRLNRPRLKGDLGEKEMQISIYVLFDVLININILLSPQVPFITQYMYQNLKKVISTDSNLYAESIHFLFIPNSEEKLIDSNIERTVATAQQIIETARKLRDNKKKSLKQPIMSLTIIDKSQEKLQSLQSLVKYIEQEINVAKVLFEPHPEKYIKFEALPNLKVLGKKLKGNKNNAQIQNAIKKLTSSQIIQARQKGSIKLLGVQLNTKQDIIILDKFIQNNIKEYQAIGGESIFVLLDVRQDEDLKIKGFSRQFINRIQKLKKKAHINTEDKINIFYKFPQKSVYLNQALQTERKNIQNAVKKPLLHYKEYRNHSIIDQQTGVIDEEVYEIIITKPEVIILRAQIQKQFDALTDNIVALLINTPYKMFEENGEKGYTLRLDNQDIHLKLDVHYRITI